MNLLYIVRPGELDRWYARDDVEWRAVSEPPPVLDPTVHVTLRMQRESTSEHYPHLWMSDGTWGRGGGDAINKQNLHVQIIFEGLVGEAMELMIAMARML